MKEDKKIQSLLTKYALQEPSEGFEERVIDCITESKMKHTTLTSGVLKRVLLMVFITVTITLLISTFFIQPKALIEHVPISIPINTYRQLFSFLGAFWIAMLINLWWNKRDTITIQS